MLRKIILFGFLILCIAAPVFAQGPLAEKEITAEGTAAGGSLQSKDAALNRALRNAVEQAVGALIDSETQVQNFQLLDDKIYSEVKGYVKSYEIISDNGGAGGIYTVKVKAVVALGALTKDVQALGIIREKLNYPRVMVLVTEYIDGVEQPQRIAGTAIEKVFMENKFPVVSKEQTEMIKERDATLSYADPAKAAALGRRYGAEVVVVGQATSSLADTSTPYGVSVYAYQARVEAKAVKTDNAQVLAIDTATQTERANGRVPAANKAMSAAAETISGSFMQKIAEAWRSEIYNEGTIQLICENADMEKALSFKKALSAIRDVKGVNERSLVNNVLELDVRFFGSTDQFATLLSELKSPAVKITAKTPNRIDIKFTE
jgi:hypothetical protein